MEDLFFAATKEAFEQHGTYPGYPETRLVLPRNFDDTGIIEIPDGPWETKKDPLPSSEETDAFICAGYQIDTLGRPLHPWLKAMATSPAVGVVTGKGQYYNWGPNYAADPIVITNEPRPQVLLIQRSDTGRWALPGGFVDPEETDTEQTALRELAEETGLHIHSKGEHIYDGVVADLRTTAHAWVETSAYLFTVDAPLPVAGQDDALNAEWHYIDSLDTLYGSHAVLIQLALERLRKLS